MNGQDLGFVSDSLCSACWSCASVEELELEEVVVVSCPSCFAAASGSVGC